MQNGQVFIFREIPGVPERIWRKITVSSISSYKNSPCWEWQRQSRTDGYGVAFIGKLRYEFAGFPPKARTTVVHRLMYLISVGDPGELQVDHLCRNRCCCNPLHLEAVAQPENLRRGDSSRIVRELAEFQSAQTHCMRGHLLEDYNLIVNFDEKGGKHRHCRTCQRVIWKEFAQRKRDEKKRVISV
jgi:HNH endonuclease